MAQWIKCTDNKSGETLYVNVDNAMSMAPGRRGGTIIAFPGDKNDYAVVSESPENLLGRNGSGARSCPCGDATADHAD